MGRCMRVDRVEDETESRWNMSRRLKKIATGFNSCRYFLQRALEGEHAPVGRCMRVDRVEDETESRWNMSRRLKKKR